MEFKKRIDEIYVPGPPSMTDEAAAAWGYMGLKKKFQIERLREWANMLESRVAELDPQYRSSNWGRTVQAQSTGEKTAQSQ
jgi:hypothetical protein